MGLTDRQRELLASWLPSAEVVKDHSWGVLGTLVLELSQGGDRYIAKAGDETDHHLARELRAHREWLRPWTAQGRGPQLVHADADAKLLLTRYLPGQLVQGSPYEWTADTYYQAGELLAEFHQQSAVDDAEYETVENGKALTYLAAEHRIAPDLTERLRGIITAWPTPPATLVPTHGDWQPRNWLIDRGTVRVIDLGRADLRPAYTDLARLAAQQFRTKPALEPAFIEGYGKDPRDPDAWVRTRLREAVSTAVWAYQVGDETFEQQGHRMIAEALAAGPSH
ncbi:phosphotransferase [Kribbella solani]|uniref:phosphotransferase n=1 Tax=Kribbella solani TaxID=236067 RepID=UPI0029B92A06|nr:phosphotransferase [Kribbella solani]MDX3005430.1 phosphotransferase [Kribbella solani]